MGCSLHAYSSLWQSEEGIEFSAARLAGGFEFACMGAGNQILAQAKQYMLTDTEYLPSPIMRFLICTSMSQIW